MTSGIWLGINGFILSNNGIILFQTIQITADIRLKNGFDLGTPRPPRCDKLKDRKIGPIILAKLLDEEILAFVDKPKLYL